MSNKNEIEYKDSYVAFLDVLGFTNLVFNSEVDKLNKYLKVINESIKNLEVLLAKYYDINFGFIVISDAIIITAEKNTKVIPNKRLLGICCSAIAYLQRKLAIEDIWIRGAVSSGEAYFNKEQNQIIGKAYIDAYKLEEQQAKYPRVIIDSRIIKELEYQNANELIEDSKTLFDREIYFNWNIDTTLEKDIPLFIDYISFVKKDPDFKEKVKIIINNVENNIYSKTELYTKFKWVAEYLRVSLLRIEKESLLTKKLEEL